MTPMIIVDVNNNDVDKSFLLFLLCQSRESHTNFTFFYLFYTF